MLVKLKQANKAKAEADALRAQVRQNLPKENASQVTDGPTPESLFLFRFISFHFFFFFLPYFLVFKPGRYFLLLYIFFENGPQWPTGLESSHQ